MFRMDDFQPPCGAPRRPILKPSRLGDLQLGHSIILRSPQIAAFIEPTSSLMLLNWSRQPGLGRNFLGAFPQIPRTSGEVYPHRIIFTLVWTFLRSRQESIDFP